MADNGNNRVLEYNTPLTSGTTADTVFGQGGSFASGTANNGGLSEDSLSSPTGIAVDASGNLYVADDGNNRVLEYNCPAHQATPPPIPCLGRAAASPRAPPTTVV